MPAKAVLIRNLVLGCRVPDVEHHALLPPGGPELRPGPGIPPWTPYFARQLLQPAAAELTAAGACRCQRHGIVPDANPDTMQLWDAVIISYVKALKIRRLTFEAGALFAGRMPMTSCYVAGGVTNDTHGRTSTARVAQVQRRSSRRSASSSSRSTCRSLSRSASCTRTSTTQANTGISACNIAAHAGKGYGAGLGRFLAWGAFPSIDNTLFTSRAA